VSFSFILFSQEDIETDIENSLKEKVNKEVPKHKVNLVLLLTGTKVEKIKRSI
jgi:hypothetical protein